jgi:uncharacterized protein
MGEQKRTEQKLLFCGAVRIRDPIHGTILVSEAEKAVVDSAFFQRLRTVRQLGFGELAFPGATHTRHAHSLGAMHVAGKLFDSVTARVTLPAPVSARFRASLRLAALCHDLGHMPFSHASEKIAPIRATLSLPNWLESRLPAEAQASHEDFTARILLDSSLTDIVNQAYAEEAGTAVMAASLVTGVESPEHDVFTHAGVDWFPALRALVSGELDADRMDYLLRDSFYTGVNYGRFDFEWLTQNIQCAPYENGMALALSKAAVFAFEDFLLSRYHMFLSVYYHHTAVCFDAMLQQFYDESPAEFQIPSTPEAFLWCDDVALHHALRRSDNRWAKRIVERRGYKRVAQFTQRDSEYDVDAISQALRQAKIEHFALESKGVLSKYFEGGYETSLFVVDSASKRLTPIARYTPLYEQFRGAVTLSRVYVLPEQLHVAEPLVQQLTNRAERRE